MSIWWSNIEPLKRLSTPPWYFFTRAMCQYEKERCVQRYWGAEEGEQKKKGKRASSKATLVPRIPVIPRTKTWPLILAAWNWVCQTQARRIESHLWRERECKRVGPENMMKHLPNSPPPVRAKSFPHQLSLSFYRSIYLSFSAPSHRAWDRQQTLAYEAYRRGCWIG